jgi:leader peptidase (prepilin peptidase)/N-methyltransferase
MSAVAAIDWQYLMIPNKLMVGGLIIGFALKVFSIGPDIQRLPFTPWTSLFTAMVCLLLAFCSMLLLLLVGNWLFKKPSLGMGDVKLAALVGFFLGFQNFLIALWLAAIVGCFYAIFFKSNRKPLLNLRSEMENRKSKMDHASNAGPLLPFGSFLAVSSSFVLLFSEPINALLGSWLTLMQ